MYSLYLVVGAVKVHGNTLKVKAQIYIFPHSVIILFRRLAMSCKHLGLVERHYFQVGIKEETYCVGVGPR